MTASERGAALLEVIVALTILTVAATGFVAAGAQSLHAIRTADEAAKEIAEADAFLDAVALWSREDLDRRLGDRPQGPWRLRIHRPEPGIYLVTLADSAGSRTLLQTALHRQVPDAQSE